LFCFEGPRLLERGTTGREKTKRLALEKRDAKSSTATVLLRHRWDGVSGLRRRAGDNAVALSFRRPRGRFVLFLGLFWHGLFFSLPEVPRDRGFVVSYLYIYLSLAITVCPGCQPQGWLVDGL
jgi:hypothetical protein